MVKTKITILMTVVVMVLIMSAVLLIGCDKDKTAGESEYTPGEAFAQVAKRIMESDDMKIGKQMSADIIVNMGLRNHRISKSKQLQLTFSGNADYREESTNKDNNFVIELRDMNDNSKLFGLYADGEFLYIDLITEHYKIENFKLRDVIMGKDKQGRSIDTQAIFEFIGNLLFESVSISNDGNEYAFGYNMVNVVKSLESIINLIGEGKLNKLASQLGYDNWEHFVTDVLGEIKGELVYHFDDKGNLSTQEWHNKGDLNSYSITSPKFAIKNTAIDIDFSKYIDNTAQWISTKLMNLKLNGSFNIINGRDNVGVYDWELITNLDPLELLANKGDFNLDLDDMAHFIVTARKDKSSTAYNDSRVKSINGVVLELAYSPSEFGNNNVMITLNPKAILSKALVKELGIPEIAMNFLPEYYGAHIDVDILREMGNIGKIAQKSGDKSVFNVIDMLAMLKFDDSGLTVDSGVFEMLGEDISKVLGSLFTVEGKVADKLNINVSYCKFGDRTNGGYKVSDHFLYITDKENNEPKDFSGTAGFTPAKDSKPIAHDGFVEITSSTGKKINTNDGALNISPLELPTLIGGKISYNYIDFYGKSHLSASPVTILGLSNVDSSNIGGVQNVNIITSLPDGKNLISLISTLKIMPELPGNVYTTKLVLTAEKTTSLSFDNELNYRVGDELKDTGLAANLLITYTDDSSYSYKQSGYVHDLKLTKIGSKQIISEPGSYVVTYSIGGRSLERAITVASSDSVSIQLDSEIIGKQGNTIDKSYGKVILAYGDELVEYSIGKEFITFPSGAIEEGKFKVAGEYHININAFGAHIKALVTVSPRSIVLP